MKHDPDFIAEVAGNVLSDSFGTGIRLQADGSFITGGSVVVRCRNRNSETDLPESVIVKKVREDEYDYRPDSQESPNPAHWLFNDWAACQFLHDIQGDVPLGPRLYGGSREFGLIVLEDLGSGETPNTYDALLGDDPDLAEETLIEHVSLIGHLHGETIGRAEEYKRMRQELGPLPIHKKLFHDPWSDARTRPIAAEEVEEAMKLYLAVFESLSVRAEPGVSEEIWLVASAVESCRDQFLAFCKGDQNEAGDYIRQNGKPRLFDFGEGGFRHALIEGMPARFTWGCTMKIPKRLTSLMDAAYRSQLMQEHPEINEDAFKQAMIEAGARWHIFHVVHRLPDALSRERQRGLTTLRQQTFAWLTAFVELQDELGDFPALGKSARRIVDHLRNIWPADVCTLPHYPAFKVASR